MTQSKEKCLAGSAANGDITALAELQRLATNGHVEAAFLLGRLYDVPEKSALRIDLSAARSWYHKAALQGHALAQLAAGNMYDYGDGGDQDYEKARQWYESAAKHDVHDAQMHFARMLQTGRGGYQSVGEAAYWYGKSAALGNELAATNLALMHLRNEVENASDSEAKRLLLFSAEKRDGVAHFMLGEMFLQGRGGEQHGGRALLHFCIAALLLPAGAEREVAVSRKETILAQHPTHRQRFEAEALAYLQPSSPVQP